MAHVDRMTKNVMWTSVVAVVVVVLLPISFVGAIECNNLKRFRCKRGGEGPANGCTWVRDSFKTYRRFPGKKKLFGICLNAGQSVCESLGTPAERCDCGTKCKRKCTQKHGYKKNCYFAGPRLAGTCLPTSRFTASYSCGDDPVVNQCNADLITKVSAWVASPVNATITYGNITTWDTSCVTSMKELFRTKATFNEDISKWNTSEVTSMQ